MTKAFLIDAVERIFWTFSQVFGATLLASPVFDNLGLGWQDALKVSAFAAAAAALKAVLALNVGSATPQLGANTYTNTTP